MIPKLPGPSIFDPNFAARSADSQNHLPAEKEFGPALSTPDAAMSACSAALTER
jgi:hypothetical protein